MFGNPFYKVVFPTDCQETLSVAALHAVVASVGGEVALSTHALDSMGIDASCFFYGTFAAAQKEPAGKTLRIQLKSTRNARTVKRDGKEYWALSVDVRALAKYKAWGASCILVLFILPTLEERERWVTVDEEAVILRRSLYWTSLEHVQIDRARLSNVVYVPKSALLTPDALLSLVASIKQKDFPR